MRNLEVKTTNEFISNSDLAIESLKEIIDDTARRASKIDEIDRPLEVKFDWADSKFVKEKMNGVHGLTRNPEKIEFKLSTETSNWKPFLKSQFAHELAHTIFMAPLDLKYESNIENWRHVLLEAHGQLFA